MDESRFRHYLAEVAAVIADRRQQLPAPVRALYRQILQHFADVGGAPSAEMFRAWAADAGADSREALAVLGKTDLAETDPDTGRIFGAYPFSVTSRGHEVGIEGGPTVQAYCALDALGIPAMLGRDADITSRDPHSGVEIRVQVRSGQPTCAPPGVIASIPADDAVTGTDQPAADVACPTVNFFASADNADAYQQAHGLTLEVLTISQAQRFGSAAFGQVLRPDGG